MERPPVAGGHYRQSRMKKSFALRLAALALAAVGLFTLSSCSTAEVKDVWTAPDVTNLKFKKVLVIAITPGSRDGAARRTIEDAIVHAMPSLQAVPSYAYITEGDLQNAAKSSAAIKSAGFDGVIVMRIVSERTEVSVSPGWGNYGDRAYRPYWGGYYGRRDYWGYGYAGYTYGGWGAWVTTDHIFSIETNIYEFPSERLIWSGSVESTSPGNVKRMIDDTVGAILEHMVKQRLIPAPVKE